jgi:hypothetical protein
MTDSVAGSLALVRQLLSQGRKRIGVVSGPLGTSTADDRVAGYALALVEAGLPVEKAYIKRGQFRPEAGEALVGELLDMAEPPTAILAANNHIAIGVLSGIEKRCRAVGEDIALACFDDIPNGDRFCPWVTVLTQPAYDMGVNAAQLLLSQIEGPAALAPRRVLLPTRMIVRCPTCGSGVSGGPDTVLVKPLTDAEKGLLPRARLQAGLANSVSVGVPLASPVRQPDVMRLLRALGHQATDSVPFFEIAPVPAALYEHVVGPPPRRKGLERSADKRIVGPEQHVRFALELGCDAVPCHLAGTHLADQLDRLDGYVRAARGTGLGVVVCFAPVFEKVLASQGVKPGAELAPEDGGDLLRQSAAAAERHAGVVRAILDRFADEVALLLFTETLATAEGLLLPPDMFRASLGVGLNRLVRTVKEHGKPVGLRTSGKLDAALELLDELGFDLVHFAQPECNDMASLRQRWRGRLALAGTLPQPLLANGPATAIAEFVRNECRQAGIGHIFSSAAGSFDSINPDNLIALAHGVQLYGQGS